MRTSILGALLLVCLIVGGCTVEHPVHSLSPQTQTFKTRANAGWAFGGADTATKTATDDAKKFCVDRHQETAVLGVHVHQVATRYISEVTFTCRTPEAPAPTQTIAAQ